MGQQSARLYFIGIDHKDIYFNGHYHDKMYLGNNLVWEKLGKNWVWQKIDMRQFGFTKSYFVYDIAYGNGIFIYATPERAAYSIDGVAWEAFDFPHNVCTVNFCNGSFIATSGTCFYLTSSNGREWSRVETIYIDGKPCTDSKYYFEISRIHYAGGYYFCKGLRSSDLIQWTTIKADTQCGVGYLDGSYYLYGRGEGLGIFLNQTADFNTYNKLDFQYMESGTTGGSSTSQTRVYNEGSNLFLLANYKLYKNSGNGFDAVIDYTENYPKTGPRLFCCCDDGYLIYRNEYLGGGFMHSTIFQEYDSEFNLIGQQYLMDVGNNIVAGNNTAVALGSNSVFLYVRKEG